MAHKTESRMEWTGAQLRSVRERKGLSITQLAASCDRTEMTVRNWENDVTVPDIRDFLAICSALSCSPEALLDAA